MRLLLSIAVGGALGSVARYLVVEQFGQWFGNDFPWGTLAVNVLGGLAMGAIMQALTLHGTPELRGFLIVGVLGGFTTFSAFSLQIIALAEQGDLMLAAAYIGASVTLAVLALALGMAAVRAVGG